jgi:hypothetical protein
MRRGFRAGDLPDAMTDGVGFHWLTTRGKLEHMVNF